MRPRWLALAAGLACWCSAAQAVAQQVPSLDLHGSAPSADAESGRYYEPARSEDTLETTVGMYFNYAYRPLTLLNAAGEVDTDLVEHQVSGDVVASMGLANIATIGVGLPFVLYQRGDTLDTLAQATVGNLALPTQALGDLSLIGKLTLVKPTGGDLGGFGLALHQRVTLPTGDPASLVAEGFVTSETRVLIEYRYLALGAHGALGMKFRDHEDFGCGAEADCNTRFGHQLPFGLGFSFKPQAVGLDDEGRWTWFVETFGYLPAGPRAPFTSAALSQVQFAAGARVKLVEDVSLLMSADTALLGGIGTAPLRATLALSWSPRKHDDDNDGVPNDVDQCPEDMPEDLDGVEDGDGCPEWDNDDDGVPDESDLCEGQQEDEDGYLDDDGCPDPDNDGDGILDEADACPLEKGVPSNDRKRHGCLNRDADGDGVLLPADKCPEQREDKDGHLDDDGCPDPDNDGDGISDAEDACRNDKGVPSPANREEHGCPDGDGDGVVDKADACPAEVGERSDDKRRSGCPADANGAPAKKPLRKR